MSIEQQDNMEDLYSRFIDAYNAIDKYMRNELGKQYRDESFLSVLCDYRETRRIFPEFEQLRVFAEVRNVTIHNIKPNVPLFAPSPEAVKQIEHLKDLITSPPKAMDYSSRDVKSISPDDTIEQVLTAIKCNALSQFPVYEGKQYRGLLTENGITRWLALNVAEHKSLDDFILGLMEYKVAEVLSNEEKRKNCEFVDRNSSIDMVIELFACNAQLESVLITENGSKHMMPLGIITSFDVMQYIKNTN